MNSKEPVPKYVGQNVQNYRIRAKLTQEELAERAGISTPFLANIENGYKGMSLMTLCRVAKALGTSTDSLLYENNISSHLDNIAALLSGQPENVAEVAERMVRTLIEGIETICKENADAE